MQHSLAFDHLVVGVMVFLGFAFVAVALAASHLLAHSKPSREKGEPYECGVPPVGPPWVQLRVGYYVYALLFVVFDIETVFLYPWAVAFGALGPFVLVEMTVFIGILAAGLAYAWKQGALTWR